MSTTSTPTTLILISDDKCPFPVPIEIIQYSTVLNGCFLKTQDPYIPIHNVMGSILAKIIEYYQHHLLKDSSFPTRDVITDEWDHSFINTMNLKMMIDVLNATEYLDFEQLTHTLCLKFKTLIEGKSKQEIATMFI